MKTIIKRQATLTYKATFNRYLLGVYDKKGQLLSLMLSIGESAKLGKYLVNESGKTFAPTDMDLQAGWSEKGLKYDIKASTLEGEASNASEQDLESFFGIGKRLLEGVKATDNGVAVLNHELTYDIHGDVEGGTWEDIVNSLLPDSRQLKGYETLTKTVGFVFTQAQKESLRVYIERSFTVEKGIFFRTVFVAFGDIELPSAVDAWRRAIALLSKELAIEVR